MDRAAAMLGFDRNKITYTGRGIGIGIADTGISPHPDFFDENGFRVKAYMDFIENKSYVTDVGGHGTHVCGIACGNGNASKGRYKGIAVNAHMAAARVLDKDGNGRIIDMNKALKWFVDIRKELNIRVVNLSFSVNNVNKPEYYELERIIKYMWKSGIVVVCAAGNNGPEPESVTAPGTIKEVITVGAADDENTIYGSGIRRNYSGRGTPGIYISKPEVCAPATGIVSCEQKFLESSDYFVNIANRNKLYSAMSGTSMAAPMVSGIAALMLERNELLTPDEVKKIIMGSCKSLGKRKCVQGAGIPNLSMIFQNSDYF